MKRQSGGRALGRESSKNCKAGFDLPSGAPLIVAPHLESWVTSFLTGRCISLKSGTSPNKACNLLGIGVGVPLCMMFKATHASSYHSFSSLTGSSQPISAKLLCLYTYEAEYLFMLVYLRFICCRGNRLYEFDDYSTLCSLFAKGKTLLLLRRCLESLGSSIVSWWLTYWRLAPGTFLSVRNATTLKSIICRRRCSAV